MASSRLPPLRKRLFSTSCRRLQHSLAYHAWPGPASSSAAESKCPPILFMHGLFGSKQNNRSMSKYGNFTITAIFVKLSVLMYNLLPTECSPVI
jgi:pimeloyl-ACP methyl ester carboxylesterase